ncbi:Sec-independent protein translocase protein TatB [Bosea sp. 62]|uniref:Sec-independent protein translocase protein TatB n=1 Tax=unclassified Bosea (in: a-proteobacteria) TaxID=2653178 RepID=UPI00125811F8|nr:MULTISPECIES: Sec-independent protein translocase protein TatB [unclassified Bosea (in: a-proteobacteria)]CAD5263758.1 Sec-independent protein translocase protein TatB [Bosea sp. 46]CAD5266038.1 Sec-independent protein translocase protein TatB [Bosea sp. 21B]CAD5273662.1 Sec-independent protein translocase protein TatB [Bosea sp. 7B]VVT56627.1 Sec-independent protein translocase protein TatB [Bosea sp. EC-HK365B]VXB78403.1 Sec-independent protein translocase protein TatB [Bosea sp. 29B]
MFDIAWSEMLLIGGVALVVIGPKELPGALRTAGQAIGKIRRMAAEFQGQFNDAMREAELTDLKKQVDDIGNSIQASTNFDPIDPMKDFGATDASKPAAADDKAMQEAEATLAALPAPELPAPVSIEPATVAEPAPEEKPKRRRKTVATEEPAVPAEIAAEELPAKPARKRKAKAAEAEGGETA